MGPGPDPQDASSFMGDIKKLFEQSVGLNIIPRFLEVDKAAAEIAKSFGAGREVIDGMKQGLADAAKGVIALGGSFADIQKIQVDVSKTLGRNVILNTESFEKLYAAASVTGKEASQIVEAFRKVGVSAYRSAAGIQQVIDVARQLGANASLVTEKVLNNIDAMNKYTFQGGVEGLAKMAAQATSLKLDMNATLNFAEKVFNPEGAIQTAAALQRLGVQQSQLLDPLRLMDLAQNDPTELQNQMVKMSEQFVRLNKDGNFEIMPGAKRQLREIEQAMGYPSGELAKMALNSADLARKMKEITFPDVPEAQRNLIANMAEMGEGGQYEVTFVDKKGVEQKKLVSELSEEDIKQLGEASKPKKLEDLAFEQLNVAKQMLKSLESVSSTFEFAFAGNKSMSDLMGGVSNTVKAFTKSTKVPALSSKNISEYIDANVKGFLDYGTKKLRGEEATLPDFKGIFEKQFGEDGENVKTQVKEQFKTEFSALKEYLNKSSAAEFISALQGEIEKKISPRDFAYLPGAGVFKTFEQDTIIGLTDPNKMYENLLIKNEKPKITPQEYNPPTSYENLKTNPKTETPTTSTVKYEGKIDLNVNINAPAGIDISQLQLALNDTSVKQQIISSISKMQNNELTSQVV